MKNNLEQQLRTLWQSSRPNTNEDERDIFFEEIYDPSQTYCQEEGGRLVCAGQWTEHKMTFVGQPISVGVVGGLVVDASLRPAERSKRLGSVLSELHRRQYERGMMYSIVVPTDSRQRQWLEKQGYMTVSHQLTAECHLPEDFVADRRIVVEETMEWGRDLWIYYAQHAGLHDFELKLSEGEFYAMIARHDLNGGSLLVARRHGRIVGIALVQREGKPLKNGKRSGKQFRVHVRYVLATEQHVLYCLQQKALALHPDCKQLVMTAGCPARGFKNVEPHAMMRVIDAERFLKFVAERLPGLQLVVGMTDDADIPANNRGFRLIEGRCYVSEDCGDSPVTPGSIPAMLMAGQPVQVGDVAF